jgi:hypothetical protein
MKAVRRFIEAIILLIALGAALYTQRAPILDWMRDVSAPPLPDSVSYEDVLKEENKEKDLVKEEEDEYKDEVVSSEEIEDVFLEEEKIEGVDDLEEREDEDTEADPVEENRAEAITEDIVLPASVNLAVPFTPQAPHGNWDEPYQEACEEASVYMVERYYAGEREGLINPDQADLDLLKIVAFEEELFGYYEDTTAEQSGIFAELIFGFSNILLIEDPTVEDIKKQLVAGRPVIVPVAGRLLGNPYFTAPGPLYHMLVIRGYTVGNKFIVNDPGTRYGENYLYDFDTIMHAMHDWNGGAEITEGKKIVLVIEP